jgi:aminopeptidase N
VRGRTIVVAFLAAVQSLACETAEVIGPGVSEALARERAAAITDLRYELTFVVPAEKGAPVQGKAVVSLSLSAPHRLVFDFAQPRASVRAVRVDDVDVEADFVDGHIVIPAAATRTGANRVEFEFEAGDEALNRQDDFLYTLFVPARARLTFPCFDQPDLKARYTLQLSVPEGWEAVANGAEARRTTGAWPGTTTIDFVETPPLPTYLAAFAAGRFSVETAEREGRTLRMFHRETDPAKVSRNREAIFDLHGSALAWLESYTSIPYPWGSFDFVLIPSFQFGGMEHPGAIFYGASRLLLDESATENQQLERASVIAHETAHMWFGDLVTMRWFNDVWMKEVFANFMAAKIVNPSFPQLDHELRFLLAHYPSAYAVDRTAGANPIRQRLANLDEAGQLYGPIIYQKAPIVMRQMETIVGEDAFRDGVREYLATHAFGNATWDDLVRVLDTRSDENLVEWSRAWVEERGRPTVSTAIRSDGQGRLERVDLKFDDPLGRGVVWPQQLRVAFGDAGRVREESVFVTGNRASVGAPAGFDRPLYVLPSGAGLGYGLFLLDQGSLEYLLQHIEDVPNALTRGAAWVTLWDNLLENRVDDAVFLRAALRALPLETNEQNLQRVLDYAVSVFWRRLSPGGRTTLSASLESVLRGGLDRAPTQSQKGAWFGAYRDTVLSEEGVAWLTRLWRRDEAIPGLVLAEPDEITLALELAVREVSEWASVLDDQAARTQNPDRRARFEFVMPALSADPAAREQAFERLRLVQNRRREAWVLESLRYLNHPLRDAHARQFVGPALELLQEIQQTGDIFFPTRWMESTLWGHRSAAAAAEVREFLERESAYPERLRWTILTAADGLFRATAAASGADRTSR